MKKYKKNIGIMLFTVFATMGLGVLLLIPFFNIWFLNVIIEQETGINTRFYYRPGGKYLYGRNY